MVLGSSLILFYTFLCNIFKFFVLVAYGLTRLLQQEMWNSNIRSSFFILVSVVPFWCGTVSNRNSHSPKRRPPRVLLPVCQLLGVLSFRSIDVSIELFR